MSDYETVRLVDQLSHIRPPMNGVFRFNIFAAPTDGFIPLREMARRALPLQRCVESIWRQKTNAAL
jgi:hypothetical protein